MNTWAIVGTIQAKRAADDDHNAMMTWATVLYNTRPEALAKRNVTLNRVEVAEALVGEWIEAGRPPVDLTREGTTEEA